MGLEGVRRREEGRREGEKEGRREGGRREGGKERRREGGEEGRREGGKEGERSEEGKEKEGRGHGKERGEREEGMRTKWEARDNKKLQINISAFGKKRDFKKKKKGGTHMCFTFKTISLMAMSFMKICSRGLFVRIRSQDFFT
jgi:hypothetical protein